MPIISLNFWRTFDPPLAGLWLPCGGLLSGGLVTGGLVSRRACGRRACVRTPLLKVIRRKGDRSRHWVWAEITKSIQVVQEKARLRRVICGLWYTGSDKNINANQVMYYSLQNNSTYKAESIVDRQLPGTRTMNSFVVTVCVQMCNI